MSIERELKFSTTEEHVPSISELRAAIGASDLDLAQPAVVRQVDSYYDTAAGDLEAAGWALRIRRRKGVTLATLKGEAKREGALHSRAEIEVEMSGSSDESPAGADTFAAWPAAITAALPGGVEPERLVVQLELHVRRVAVAVSRSGLLVAELAFDEVDCRPPGQARAELGLRDSPHFTFNEVEIEAKDASGSLEALAELARAVGSLVPLTPSATSKLERARVLLGPFLES